MDNIFEIRVKITKRNHIIIAKDDLWMGNSCNYWVNHILVLPKTELGRRDFRHVVISTL